MLDGRNYRRTWTILIWAGVACLLIAVVLPVWDRPFILAGCPSDIGIVDGNRPVPIHLTIYNVKPYTLTVKTQAPGCTISSDGLRKLVIPGVGSGNVDFVFDPALHPEGSGVFRLHFQGTIGDLPYSYDRVVRYCVRRGRVGS